MASIHHSSGSDEPKRGGSKKEEKEQKSEGEKELGDMKSLEQPCMY